MAPTNVPERPTLNTGKERHFRCGITFNYKGPRRGKYGTTCRNKAVGLRRALPKQFNTRKTRVPNFNPSQGVGTAPTIAGTNTRDRKSESQISSTDHGESEGHIPSKTETTCPEPTNFSDFKNG